MAHVNIGRYQLIFWPRCMLYGKGPWPRHEYRRHIGITLFYWWYFWPFELRYFPEL